jgi:hypothetical protein
MGRIVVPVTIDGLTHVSRYLCRNPQVSGGTYNINSRALDANDIDWVAALARVTLALSNVMPTGAVWGSAHLEKFDGSVWTALAFHTPTDATTGTGYSKATQMTAVFRDTTDKKLKLVWIEMTKPAPQHFVSATAGDGDEDGLLAPFVAGGGNASDPYNWMVSHRDTYLNTSPFVGFTISLNRRVRRRRGLT